MSHGQGQLTRQSMVGSDQISNSSETLFRISEFYFHLGHNKMTT